LWSLAENAGVILCYLIGKFADGYQPAYELEATMICDGLEPLSLIVISAKSGEPIHFNLSETDLT
jgi:hypothetical protein